MNRSHERKGPAMPRRRVFGTLAAAGLATTIAPALGAAPAGRLDREEFRLPWAGEKGIDIYVRNKHPAGQSTFPGERILLFVHGSTYPASTAFDLPLAGMSAMDFFAAQGFDVYLVDLPGYGQSGRPAQMSAPAADNPAFMRTPDAAADRGSEPASAISSTPAGTGAIVPKVKAGSAPMTIATGSVSPRCAARACCCRI